MKPGDGAGVNVDAARLRRRFVPTTVWTAVAGAIFFVYAATAPGDLGAVLYAYAAVATALVAVAVASFTALAARVGRLSALAAIASAVFVAAAGAALTADPCPVGEGRCGAVEAGATGFSAMLLPVTAYVVTTVGAWIGRTVWRVCARVGRGVRRLWRGKETHDTKDADGDRPQGQGRRAVRARGDGAGSRRR